MKFPNNTLWSAVLAVSLTMFGISGTDARQPLAACTTAELGVAGKVNIATLEASSMAQKLDDRVNRIALLTLGTSLRQQVVGREPANATVMYLAAMLETQPRTDVYGLYIAFDNMDWRNPRAMLWVDRASWPKPAIVQYDFHDPRQDWYAGPKKSGKLHITNPYFDDGGSNITMISVTRPVNDTNGRFFAVAGADISLEEIHQQLKSTVGQMYLVSADGRVISHENVQLQARKGYSGEELRNLPGGDLVAKSSAGNAVVSFGVSSRTIVWATAPTTGWKVVVEILWEPSPPP